MSDVSAITTDAPRPRGRQPKTHLPDIDFNGEKWRARKVHAANIGVCDTTVKRKNYRTIIVGGVSYINVDEAFREMVSGARRRDEAAHGLTKTFPARRLQAR